MAQVKTAAKQRYLKRKARRHKVLAKARKDSAPKTLRPAAVSVESEDSETSESESEEDAEVVEEDIAPLIPFPTAIEPSGPDPALLARQGLPVGLEDAQIIPATRSPLDGIEMQLRKRLEGMGVKDLFAVQSSLLPRLLQEPLLPRPDYIPSDILVSAPTGSGKTLAYAVPLVQILSRRRVKRLRALVIVPTKELVTQVHETLQVLAKGSLTIGSTGQALAAEQKALVATSTPLAGGSSTVDILVATPGRLIDHLESTPNFSLQHLRFLVIDEADRLLAQSFQGWLRKVNSHIEARPVQSTRIGDDVSASWRGNPVVCQKLLFSATLTRDPATIATLGLRQPEYYIQGLDATQVGEQFALPDTLDQNMIVLPSAEKPLGLLHLIYGLGLRRALVFCKSVDAANRLAHLLGFFADAWLQDRVSAAVYSAELPTAERRRLLESFQQGSVNILVCSDVIARGLDASIDNVISYDAPLDMRRYVHRAGRTARAGRSGTVWTLVETQEALWFKRMVTVKNVRARDFAAYQESYQIAIKRFHDMYR